jgi:tetratricopeptide (TPR) repeat protein
MNPYSTLSFSKHVSLAFRLYEKYHQALPAYVEAFFDGAPGKPRCHLPDGSEPGVAQAHNSLGILLLRRKQLETAKAHLEKSLEIGIRLADVHL